MRPRSIATKFTLLVTILVTVIVLAASAGVGVMVYFQTEREIQRQLSTEATTIVEQYLQVSKGSVQLSSTVSGEALASALRTLDLSLYIENTQGAVLATYGTYRDITPEEQAQFIQTSPMENGMYRDISLRGNRYDTYTIPLRSSEGTVGYMQISRLNNVLPLITRTLGSTLLFILPLVWIVAAATTRMLSAAILDPLSRLVAFMDQIEVEHVSSHTLMLPPFADREVRVLVIAFNALLTRVHETITREREAAENISHELKTPLTRIASSLGVAAQGAPPATVRAIRTITRDIVQLGSQADAILDLAITHPSTTQTSCLLSPVIAELSISIPPDITYHAHLSKNFRIPMTSEHARVVWQNIFENAIKYNHHGGTLTITAKVSGSGWSVTTTNTTQERDGEDGNVFDRWWRGASSSVRGRGIGMALIRDICHIYHLTATFSIENGIATTVVAGPSLQPSS